MDDFVSSVCAVPDGADAIYMRLRTGNGRDRSRLERVEFQAEEVVPESVRSVLLAWRRRFKSAPLFVAAFVRGKNEAYVKEVPMDTRIVSPTSYDLGLDESEEDGGIPAPAMSPEAAMFAAVVRPLVRSTVTLASRYADSNDLLVSVIRDQQQHIRDLQASRDELIANQLDDGGVGDLDGDGSPGVPGDGPPEWVRDAVQAATDRIRNPNGADPDPVKTFRSWLKRQRPGTRADAFSDIAQDLEGDDDTPPATEGGSDEAVPPAAK